MSTTLQILVLGAEGTGKTLLMKRLQRIIPDNLNVQTFNSIPSTVSTVGTNLASLTWNKKKYEFRELGGPMAPIWKNYYLGCNAVIFLMDIANLVQLSASCILFYDMLIADQLPDVPVLLVLNKMDLPVGFKSHDMLTFLRFKDLRREGNRKLETVTISCATGEGIGDVITWLRNLSVTPENAKT